MRLVIEVGFGEVEWRFGVEVGFGGDAAGCEGLPDFWRFCGSSGADRLGCVGVAGFRMELACNPGVEFSALVLFEICVRLQDGGGVNSEAKEPGVDAVSQSLENSFSSRWE